MAEFGTAIKEGGRATRPSDLTSSSKQMALAGAGTTVSLGGCRPAALLCSGLASRPLLLLSLASYPFLAITRPVPSDTLVVEGWLNEYAMRQAAAEYARGNYRHLFTTGGPTTGKGGGYINDFNTSASVGAELLQKAGIQREAIQMVPSHVNDRERTYSSAIALRDWFREHNTSVSSINVLTEGAHARRTRLLYQKAFDQNVTVGIIAVSNPDYNPKQWWRYSDGVREVIG